MSRLLTLLLVVLLLLAGTVWWTGRQGAELPGWYREAKAGGELEEDLGAAARRARQTLLGRFGKELLDEVTADDGTPDESFLDRLARRGKMVLEGLREGREVRLDARDLEGVILSMAYDQEAGRELLAATRAVRAEILDGELELGAVLVPAELPEARLSADRRRLLDTLLRLAGSDGEVYVSLRAAPSAVDDRLVLGPPVDLRVGDLRLGSTLLSAVGLEAPELEQGLPLDLGNMRVREAGIAGDALVLVVSPEI